MEKRRTEIMAWRVSRSSAADLSLVELLALWGLALFVVFLGFVVF